MVGLGISGSRSTLCLEVEECVPGEAMSKEGSYTHTQKSVKSHTFLSRGRTDAMPSPALLLVFFSRTCAANNVSVSSIDKGFFGLWTLNLL
jgi:hypothetical protein